MADRERVIADLSTALVQMHGCGRYTPKNVDELETAALGALKLLEELPEEREPRVLDIDELKNFEVVWFEARNHLYIEPMLTRSKIFADASADWFRYGKEWRCWTSKPTKEQCEAVKWDVTNEDAIKSLDNLKNDIGNPQYGCLWHYAPALEEIGEMLEERRPKPVKVTKNAYNHEFYYCPNCGRGFELTYYKKPAYCDKCGQAVKWDE